MDELTKKEETEDKSARTEDADATLGTSRKEKLSFFLFFLDL